MINQTYRKISSLKNVQEFRDYLKSLGIDIPVDDEMIVGERNPLAQVIELKDGHRIGNRFCIQPMEGWDGTPDGKPTELTTRRWQNFGKSGAKLIWGGEATAVMPDGRANPNQLMILEKTMTDIENLRKELVKAHSECHETTDDLYVGLQLTHSGRFCKPNQKNQFEPKIAYHHPLLDEIFHISPDLPVLSDSEIEGIIEAYVQAAIRAQKIGFDFVDIKHCHGYLSHELLSAVERAGSYGGNFENRTRFLREIVEGIGNNCPGLTIGVRLSIFDFPPFRPDHEGKGQMLEYKNDNGYYPYAFGCDSENPNKINLDETIQLLQLMKSLGIDLVNFTAGSPYYNPHITRPAFYPPSDGYKPPEDPLVGVARHINTSANLHVVMEDMITVGSAYSYLQEFIPNVAQAVVRKNKISSVGLGRMVLSYPQMPRDILAGKALARQYICRTFSDCTTAPRNGLVSGCYPLDRFYKARPEYSQLRDFKK